MDIARRIKPAHLDLVLKIAETQQLQLAAQAVAISQPAASRILAEIETNIGSPLFVRHPKGMVMSQAGEVFVRHARVILAEVRTLEDELRHIQSGDLGEVRHDEHLVLLRQVGERPSDRRRRGAADAGVDLVEHERADRIVAPCAGKDETERQHGACQFATGRHALQWQQRRAGVRREEEPDAVTGQVVVGFVAADLDGHGRVGQREGAKV